MNYKNKDYLDDDFTRVSEDTATGAGDFMKLSVILSPVTMT